LKYLLIFFNLFLFSKVPINNPNELEDIYDVITYDKSNCVIRMLFDYLGEPSFQKGAHIYLDRFKYSNATTEDLWKCMSEASGVVSNLLVKIIIKYII